MGVYVIFHVMPVVVIVTDFFTLRAYGKKVFILITMRFTHGGNYACEYKDLDMG